MIIKYAGGSYNFPDDASIEEIRQTLEEMDSQKAAQAEEETSQSIQESEPTGDMKLPATGDTTPKTFSDRIIETGKHLIDDGLSIGDMIIAGTGATGASINRMLVNGIDAANAGVFGNNPIAMTYAEVAAPGYWETVNWVKNKLKEGEEYGQQLMATHSKRAAEQFAKPSPPLTAGEEERRKTPEAQKTQKFIEEKAAPFVADVATGTVSALEMLPFYTASKAKGAAATIGAGLSALENLDKGALKASMSAIISGSGIKVAESLGKLDPVKRVVTTWLAGFGTAKLTGATNEEAAKAGTTWAVLSAGGSNKAQKQYAESMAKIAEPWVKEMPKEKRAQFQKEFDSFVDRATPEDINNFFSMRQYPVEVMDTSLYTGRGDLSPLLPTPKEIYNQRSAEPAERVEATDTWTPIVKQRMRNASGRVVHEDPIPFDQWKPLNSRNRRTLDPAQDADMVIPEKPVKDYFSYATEHGTIPQRSLSDTEVRTFARKYYKTTGKDLLTEAERKDLNLVQQTELLAQRLDSHLGKMTFDDMFRAAMPSNKAIKDGLPSAVKEDIIKGSQIGQLRLDYLRKTGLFNKRELSLGERLETPTNIWAVPFKANEPNRVIELAPSAATERAIPLPATTEIPTIPSGETIPLGPRTGTKPIRLGGKTTGEGVIELKAPTGEPILLPDKIPVQERISKIYDIGPDGRYVERGFELPPALPPVVVRPSGISDEKYEKMENSRDELFRKAARDIAAIESEYRQGGINEFHRNRKQDMTRVTLEKGLKDLGYDVESVSKLGKSMFWNMTTSSQDKFNQIEKATGIPFGGWYQRIMEQKTAQRYELSKLQAAHNIKDAYKKSYSLKYGLKQDELFDLLHYVETMPPEKAGQFQTRTSDGVVFNPKGMLLINDGLVKQDIPDYAGGRYKPGDAKWDSLFNEVLAPIRRALDSAQAEAGAKYLPRYVPYRTKSEFVSAGRTTPDEYTPTYAQLRKEGARKWTMERDVGKLFNRYLNEVATQRTTAQLLPELSQAYAKLQVLNRPALADEVAKLAGDIFNLSPKDTSKLIVERLQMASKETAMNILKTADIEPAIADKVVKELNKAIYATWVGGSPTAHIGQVLQAANIGAAYFGLKDTAKSFRYRSKNLLTPEEKQVLADVEPRLFNKGTDITEEAIHIVDDNLFKLLKLKMNDKDARITRKEWVGAIGEVVKNAVSFPMNVPLKFFAGREYPNNVQAFFMGYNYFKQNAGKPDGFKNVTRMLWDGQREYLRDVVKTQGAEEAAKTYGIMMAKQINGIYETFNKPDMLKNMPLTTFSLTMKDLVKMNINQKNYKDIVKLIAYPAIINATVGATLGGGYSAAKQYLKDDRGFEDMNWDKVKRSAANGAYWLATRTHPIAAAAGISKVAFAPMISNTYEDMMQYGVAGTVRNLLQSVGSIRASKILVGVAKEMKKMFGNKYQELVDYVKQAGEELGKQPK